MSTKHSDVASVLTRLKEVFGVKKDSELARGLDVSPQTLSSWRQRSAIPYALCVEYAAKKGVSLDWLLYGDTPLTSGGYAQAPQTTSASPIEVKETSDIQQRILRVLENLAEEDLADILSEAQHRERLRTLEQRFKTLQATFVEDAKKVG